MTTTTTTTTQVYMKLISEYVYNLLSNTNNIDF